MDLNVWLENVLKFSGCTINGKVNDKVFDYTVAKDGDSPKWTATPNTEDAVRAAWQTLTGTDLLTANTNETADNSKIIIGHGAYLQIGKEKLVFDEKDGTAPLTTFLRQRG